MNLEFGFKLLNKKFKLGKKKYGGHAQSTSIIRLIEDSSNAKLRDKKSDNNIQLLKCKMEAAGHGGMSGRDNAITELAEEYSFILKSANILK